MRGRLAHLTLVGLVGAVILCAAAAVALAVLGMSPAIAFQAVVERSPGEIIRHLQRRLVHHDKLQAVLDPLLDAAQRQFERPIQLGVVPSYGRGAHKGLGSAAASIPGEIQVSNVSELRAAMQRALSGQTIVLSPGSYQVNQRLRTGNPGTALHPIVVRAAQPGAALLEVNATMGVRVTQPHWHFEGLHWKGTCPRHDDCEHALQVVGAAQGTHVRNNWMQDFNAHVKVNGEGGQYPDRGLIEFSTLWNDAPRNTTRSVVSIDIVAASSWQVRDNVIHDIVKSDGNRVSFAAYMKGGGHGGRFERNVVVCTRRDISQPGVRVGLSFGGGGTGNAYCRGERCVVEFERSVFENNLVAHCNDSGLDINGAIEIRAVHNTLVNTAGIQLRGVPATAVLEANVLDGAIRGRDGERPVQAENRIGDTRKILVAPDELDIAWMDPAPSTAARASTDLCGTARLAVSPPGALAGPRC